MPTAVANYPFNKPKVLIFILARRGCIAYANEMTNLLQHYEIKIYASCYSEETLPEGSYVIPTFRNSFEFIGRTLWTIPNFLWKIRADFRQGYRIFYFPVSHHWNPIILLAAKWLGAKTVLTIHDAVAHPGEPQLVEDWFQNWAIRLANQLIALSEFVKNQLSARFQNKTHVIPHPLLFSETSPPVRIPSQCPKLLFLGRIARYKGVDLLLEAVKNFPAGIIEKLTIAGLPMQETLLPDATFPIQKIERWLNDAEVLQLLHEHDILILPYREASQSGVVTLGISSAIPMAVTKVGGLQEQLAQNEAIWVEPSAESIQKGILELIEKPELYQNLYQKLVQKRAAAKPDQIREQLEMIFQNLLDNNKK